jgi:hypothetical protein
MENQTVKITKWFWAWNDDKEEAWLGRMARTGMHLQSIGLPGKYTFLTGEPREDIYRLDYIIKGQDHEHYLQLFRDAGWEYLGEMGGWQYFRTRKENNQVPEIYTDNASKTKKYTRLLTHLTIFLPIYVVLATRPVSTDGNFSNLYSIVRLIMSLILVLYAYAMVRLFMRINQLRKKI